MQTFKAWVIPHRLKFKGPAGTSRGTLYEKQVYYLVIRNEKNGNTGIGESTTIPGLSIDDRSDCKNRLQATAKAIEQGEDLVTLKNKLTSFPSIIFGLEIAFKDLENGGKRLIFPTSFANGPHSLKINGLIWMNDYQTMLSQIHEKIEQGFDCIKLKIAAIAWDKELSLLEEIRANYSANSLEIRVDANGAFPSDTVMAKLSELAYYQVHSIEQPIATNNTKAMAEICRESPLPVALDEELIGYHDRDQKVKKLDTIQPQHLILKPSLIGGFEQADEWIRLAEERGIGWWATSALESNIGLNAIAQWVAQWKPEIPQGLGTGGLYTNNIPSPLEIDQGHIYINKNKSWNLNPIWNLSP